MRNVLGQTRGVLFDLDGTLLDTAPDMGGALNRLRLEEQLEPLPLPTIRPHVSHGATALVRLGFPAAVEPELTVLRQRYLEIYRRHLAAETRLYAGLDEALERLAGAGLAWGIVTNKPAWLTDPLLEELGLRRRVAVVVSGDTLPVRKPDPAPLLYAADKLGIDAAECIYIGDAERDVTAARAADMRVFVALFGYIPEQESPRDWPATGWLDSPPSLVQLLDCLISQQTRQAP